MHGKIFHVRLVTTLETSSLMYIVYACFLILKLVTDQNKFLWPKPNRNRISASILVSAEIETLRALFTKFLTPGLTREFCNPLDDWLDWLIPANHQADYKIRGLTQELKSW